MAAGRVITSFSTSTFRQVVQSVEPTRGGGSNGKVALKGLLMEIQNHGHTWLIMILAWVQLACDEVDGGHVQLPVANC